MNRRGQAARWLREPLLHFLLIGALLFALSEWRGRTGTQRIVVTPGQVQTLVAGFQRTWQRPPDERELKSLLDELVREEIATREAIAMGLDRDDAVVRRRLRQKFEFLVEEEGASAPSDAVLQAWLDAHAERYRGEPRLTFRQVALVAKPGRVLEDDAKRLVAQLARAGPEARIDKLGDALMLPAEVERMPLFEVGRVFGSAFAQGLAAAPNGAWSGPVRSGYGLHAVLVREIETPRAPTLAEARVQVERDYVADQRKRGLEARYAKLLERYPVVIEKPAAPAGTAK